MNQVTIKNIDQCDVQEKPGKKITFNSIFMFGNVLTTLYFTFIILDQCQFTIPYSCLLNPTSYHCYISYITWIPLHGLRVFIFSKLLLSYFIVPVYKVIISRDITVLDNEPYFQLVNFLVYVFYDELMCFYIEVKEEFISSLNFSFNTIKSDFVTQVDYQEIGFKVKPLNNRGVLPAKKPMPKWTKRNVQLPEKTQSQAGIFNTFVPFHASLEQLTEQITILNNNIRDIKDQIPVVDSNDVNHARNVLENLSDLTNPEGIFKLLKGFSQDFLYVAGLFSVFMALRTKNSINTALFITMATYCFKDHPMYKKLVDYLKDFTKEGFSTQGGTDPISGLISILWCIYTGKQDLDLKGFKKTITDFGKLAPSVELFINWFFDFIDTFFDQLCLHYGFINTYRFGTNPDRVALTFVTEAKEILCSWSGDSLHRCQEVADRLKSLINSGEMIVMNSQKFDRGNLSIVSTYLNELRKIMAFFSESKLTIDGLRQEPVCTLFKGCPGNFKTSTVQHLSTYLVGRYVKDFGTKGDMEAYLSNPNDFMFNREHEVVYWEGYNPRKVITFLDDFGQAKDVAGNADNEFMNLIRMVNEHEMHLHMASIEKKDSTFFTSKFVVVTSNLDIIQPVSINSAAALDRRFDDKYIVVPKPQFAENPDASPMNRKVDKAKLELGIDGVTSNDPHYCLDFVELVQDPTSKDDEPKYRVTNVLDFDGVCQRAYDRFLKKRAWFNQKKKELNNTRDSIFSKEDLDAFNITQVPTPCTLKVKTNYVELDKYIMSKYAMYIDKMDQYLLALGFPTSAYYRQFLLGAACEKFGAEAAVTYIFKGSPEISGIRLATAVGQGIINEEYNRSVENTLEDHVEKHLSGLANFAYHIMDIAYEYKAYILAPITILVLKQIWSKWFETDLTASSATFIAGEDVIPFTSTQSVFDYDQGALNIVNKVVKKNSYEFFMECEGQTQRLGYITFIVGQTALMPQHFMYQIQRATKQCPDIVNIWLKSNLGDNFDHKISYLEFKKMNTFDGHIDYRDLQLIVFPFIRCHADIQSFFISNTTAMKLDKFPAVLVHPGRDVNVDNHTYATKSKCRYSDPEGHTWNYDMNVFYALHTTKGDCGSILFNVNKSLQREKIYGIHVSGDSSRGIGQSTIVTQQDLIFMLQKIPKFYRVQDINVPLETQAEDTIHSDRFVPIFKLQKYPTQFYKSSYKRSQLYESFGPSLKSLSLLHPKMIDGEMVDPLYEGLKNYGSADVFLNSTLLSRVGDNYLFFLKKRSVFDITPRLLDMDECIKGIEGEIAYGSVNRQSSLGYPWNCESHAGFKGKEYIFGKDDDYDTTSPAFILWKKTVDIKEQMLRDNIRPQFYFTDCLKDEKLKKAKVLAGKTRVFSAANFELVYLFRKYFGSFTLWFNKNKIYNGSAIGLNPYSADWDAVAKMLTNMGGHPDKEAFGAGDYSKFDGSEKARVHYEILSIINKWYNDGEDNARIRRILWLEVVNSTHVVKGDLVMWNNSLPSGHPMTPIINNMYNHLAFRYAWGLIVGIRPSDLQLFDEHVYLITMGDDNLFSVSPTYSSVFTESNISIAMKELGLTYTSDTKDGVNMELRSLDKVTFLKRSFVYNQDLCRWIAPLDFDTIIQMMYWVKKKGDENELISSTIDTSIRELSFHGRIVFQEWIEKIKKEVKVCYPNVVPRTLDYDIALDIAINSDVAW